MCVTRPQSRWFVPDSISNKAAITGIGQTVYARGMNRGDASFAMEAIASAIKDAGLTPKDIDGISHYDIDTNVEQDEVVFMVSEFLHCRPDEPYIGMPVEVEFEEHHGMRLPKFRPAKNPR